MKQDDEALIATPSFFMYDVSVQMMTPHLRKVQADAIAGVSVRAIYGGDYGADEADYRGFAEQSYGRGGEPRASAGDCAAAPQAVLMVDEAYYHFDGESVMDDLATVPNLIVARTFSKAYGLANLRIGMLAGNAELMKYVRKVSSPYNVNGVALDCLPVALADEEYVAWYAEQVRVGRERMMDGLRELGVPFFPSHANFVLMKIGPKHKELVQAMRAHGVLLRDRSTDPGCDGFVRITIGVEEHVTRGLAALKNSLDEIGWKKQEVGESAGHQDGDDVREFE